MSEKARFTPIRGAEETLLAYPYVNGQLYFATDTGKMYLDCIDPSGEQKEKLSVGGGGVSVIYGNDINPIALSEEENNTEFSLRLDTLEAKCHVGDLILNSDGCFYKVLSITTVVANCTRLAVSGSGGGSGSSIIDIFLDYDSSTIEQGYTYIYGASTNGILIPSFDGVGTVSMTFSIIDAVTNEETYKYTAAGLTSGQPYYFDTSILPLSSNITLIVTVSAMNSLMAGQSRSWTFANLSTVEMGIQKSGNSYIPMVGANDAMRSITLYYTPIGGAGITEQLHIYIDGDEDTSYNIPTITEFGHSTPLVIKGQSYGAHTIELAVSTVINGSTIYSDKISYTAAWADNSYDVPIIWLGEYDKEIINYESSYVNFMVYDPIAENIGSAAEVNLYQNGILINQLSVSYSNSGWAVWDISSLYEIGTNNFTISCRGTSVSFDVTVTNIGARDLGLVNTDGILVNVTSAGRSNLEIAANRKVWKDSVNNAELILNDFNWQNNGWRNDGEDAITGVDSGAYLAIANEANVLIPMPTLTLNSAKNYSFECRFRVRNVQEYSTLTKITARYYYLDENGVQRGGSTEYPSLTEEEIQAAGYEIAKDEYGNLLMDEDATEKTTEDTHGVVLKWLNTNGEGFVIGSQEAYFCSPSKVTSVKYCEDEVINISFVVSYTDHRVDIYLNGILSGSDPLLTGAGTDFTINTSYVEINSNYCDFDLYRFRVYEYGLSMPDVIHNYLSDMHNIKLYDQNQLTEGYDPTALSYTKLLSYNENHPDELSMPYATWQITDGENENLPYKKGNNRACTIEFVNPSLDKALADGTIDEWFYYTHSPSFKADNVDINVQGTSSQKYPRRNYKTKYKSAKNTWVYTHGSLAGQPLTGKYTVLDSNGNSHKLSSKFHMDNEYVGTNKFTWKIDYMESSATYNTGFANLMGNNQHPLYLKHPLDDLKSGNSNISTDGMRTTVYGFPVLTFHKFADGSYEYIGRYNMNLDKSSNEYYGFEIEEEQPYIDESWEEELEDGSVVTHDHPLIVNVAECWELKDNQGTWCSFKYPDTASRQAGFGTLQSGTSGDNAKLEVIQHFEYRYSNAGDDLDDAYEYTPNDTIGANNAQINTWLRNKHANLEKLFNWLDSTCTDADAITGNDLPEPIVYPVASQVFDDDSITYEEISEGSWNATFTKDTKEYRRQKFRNEFSKHLDKEYCLVYFVLTELLLCYDSRGKNMMMASFGPIEKGGEYIWYPIFYDIDTQLGLNNSGAYLWDYDADVTQDGLFSTPTSTLWVNFYQMFYDDIVQKYRVLRGLPTNSTKINGSLTYENVNGAYICNPTVFKSYAMQGVRPIVAIGLDEYYKYLAPAVRGKGYYDTSGNLLVQDTPTYVYACQGDKKLTTELLLRNRLNYLDSWWLGGDYTSAVVPNQIYMRANYNNPDTSDIYLDSESISEVPSDYASRMTLAKYSVPYFDAIPGYKIRPFLKQYITYFADGSPTEPKKFNGGTEGIQTNVSNSVMAAYLTQPNGPQQINYIPGGDFISSLGDLSVAYLDNFEIYHGKRLLDITLGSDIPGYKNPLLKSSSIFNLYDGEDSTNKKALLKKVNFSQLTDFDVNINLRGSEKLQEYRGLGTKIKVVQFANGAPLHTVHLPKTTTIVELIESKNLTNILTSKPVVAKWVNKDTQEEIAVSKSSDITDFDAVEVVYTDPSLYRGLYLEDVTDYTSANVGAGHAISSLTIEGGGLGFNSYTILANLIALKKTATSNNTLKVSLKDVVWTPYTQVEYGASYDSTKSGVYYKVNDHSKFDAYTYVNNDDDATWNNDTFNGLVYILDPVAYNSNPITSLSFLDDLISLYNNGTFTGASAGTLPTITGEVFVKNTTQIEEDNSNSNVKTLNYYKGYFPNLDIKAARIRESNIIKFVQKLDSGKIETIELLRTSNSHPIMTDIIPTKTNYDFIGWTTDVAGEEVFVEYDNSISAYVDLDSALENYTFSTGNTTLTLYAKFITHKHPVDFIFPDGTVQTIYTTYNEIINTPADVPYKDDTALDSDKTYAFLGWGFNQNSTEVINVNTFKVTKDYLVSSNNGLYAIFNSNPISVFDNIHPEWFEIVNENESYELTNGDGTKYTGLQIKLAKKVKGKLTIPAQINGVNVVKISSNNTGINTADPLLEEITHVFFQKIDGITPVKMINNQTFRAVTSLKYFEFAAGLLEIGMYAFQAVDNLSEVQIIDGTVTRLGNGCFIHAFKNGSSDNKTGTLLIDGNVKVFGSNSFMNLNDGWFDTLQLGTSSNPMAATAFNTAFSKGSEQHFNQIIVYASNSGVSPYNSKYELLLQLFGSSHTYSENQITIS